MVRASRYRRDRTMSVLLLTIVMVFIICNTARVTINLFEAAQVNIGKKSPADLSFCEIEEFTFIFDI